MAQPQQRRLQALRNDPDLARFVVEGRATGKQLGTGSYGSVEEVVVKGLVCAGKKIHELLLDAGNIGVRDICQKYLHECQMMSDLRHPNITQFLGICFLPDCQLPVLLMEKLDGSLDELLETVPNISLALKRSMLEDVARGLLYLHTHDSQIIHRDLTAKNVLLTSSLVAKITDFGNSRIVNLQPGQLAKTMSRLPGTLVYMPPEALSASSRYGPSLDIFSFGHLALFTITQVFPGDLLESTHPDPNNSDQVLGRSEVERRREYIDLLEKELHGGDRHPLTQLVKQCLRNDPSRRPVTEQLVMDLQGVRADTEGEYGELAKLDAVRQVVIMKQMKRKEAMVQEKTDELRLKCEENHQLQLQLQQAQIEAIRQENLQLQKERELQERDLSLQQMDVELQRTHKILQQRTSELLSVQKQLHNLQLQSESLKTPLSLKWKSVSSMPFAMCDYPQTVVLNGKVYVGGRWAKSPLERQVVAIYDPQKDVWDTLPPYDYSLFAMASVNNQLILIGGRDEINHKRSAVVGAWNEELKSWTNPFLPMPTARYSPTAVSYGEWLVVIGGRLKYVYAKLSEVEILDTALGQWHCAAPLPQPYSSASPVIVGNTCYVIGGFAQNHIISDQVYSVCLDDLISQAISQQPASASASILNSTIQVESAPLPWQVLPSTPLSLSTAFTLKGALLAVGGEKNCRKRGAFSKAIHLYQIGSKKWIKVGELQTSRSGCACTLLPSGEIFVTGGTTPMPEVVEIGTEL